MKAKGKINRSFKAYRHLCENDHIFALKTVALFHSEDLRVTGAIKQYVYEGCAVQDYIEKGTPLRLSTWSQLGSSQLTWDVTFKNWDVDGLRE